MANAANAFAGFNLQGIQVLLNNTSIKVTAYNKPRKSLKYEFLKKLKI